jgi:hypothetical protein
MASGESEVALLYEKSKHLDGFPSHTTRHGVAKLPLRDVRINESEIIDIDREFFLTTG